MPDAHLSDGPLRQPSAACQSAEDPKLAAAYAHDSTPPDWLWSENRKLLPTVFQEIQALCGRDFILDTAASDSGDGAHCTDLCSLSNSFMSKTHTGHIWINAPFTLLTTFVQHYLDCKQLSPDTTSACILVPGYLLPLKSMLSGMTCLKRYTKGAALFEHSTRSGHLAVSPSLSWPVYIFFDVPTGANQAFNCGQSMHYTDYTMLLSSLLLMILDWNLTSVSLCCLKDPLLEASEDEHMMG